MSRKPRHPPSGHHPSAPAGAREVAGEVARDVAGMIMAGGFGELVSEADLRRRACAAYREGERERAVSLFWQALRLAEPRRPLQASVPADRAEALLGLCRMLAGGRDHALAAEAAEAALALLPDEVEGLALLSLALRRADRLPEAREAAERAVRIAPGKLAGHARLAEVMREAGDPGAAVAAARRAIEADPENPDAHALHGIHLHRAGDIAGAVAAFREALGRSPGRSDFALRLGHAEQDRGEAETALEHYRQAAALDPRSGPAAAALIDALHGLGRTPEAVHAYARAIKAVPGYTSRHFDFLFPPSLASAGAADVRSDLPADRNHAVLVNPPHVFPNPPLAIAFLKSYAEKKGGYSVRCLDLAAKWFQDVARAMAEGRIPFRLDDQETFLEAARVFTEGGPAFFEEGSHDRLARCFSQYRALLCDTFSARAQGLADDHGLVPWYVREYARLILAGRPFVVGFSVTFTPQLGFALLAARAIKTLCPDTTIVFGGGFFNRVNVEEFLSRPSVDYLVLNEGEAAFLALLEALNGKGELRTIPGLCFKERKSGEIIVRENAFDVKHDTLPYADYSDFDFTGYYCPSPVVPVISSRGCYWRRCTFCDHFAAFAGTYKVQSITRVVDEIEHHMKTLGARHFSFVDEMISAKRFRKIADEILRRGLDLHYFALAKPTRDFTPEILSTMARSGCRCIYWGIESGSERVLALMDKGNDVEGSAATLQASARAGIRNHLFLIVGFPSETWEEARKTMDFAFANRQSIDMILANPFVLKKGTPIFSEHRRFGIRRILDQRSLCNHRLLDYETSEGMTPRYAHRLAEYLSVNFYDHFSPRGRYFGTPRNHIILIYGEAGSRNAPRGRKIPPPVRIQRDVERLGAELPPAEEKVTMVPRLILP